MDSGVVVMGGRKMDVRDSESLPREAALRVGTFVGHRSLVGQQTAALCAGVHLVTTTSHQIIYMARSKKEGQRTPSVRPGEGRRGQVCAGDGVRE